MALPAWPSWAPVPPAWPPSTWARSAFVRPRKPAPLDASVDYEGDGPLAPEVVDNDDPSPGVP
jgi:hypothetical protein